jgi:nucleotide-binding universal stress UspA family protein
MRIKKLLVPIDFSPASRVALEYAVAFARIFRAKLTLLHLIEPSTALALAFPDEAVHLEKEHHQQSERMLTAMIATESQRDLDVKALVKSGDVDQQILSTMHEEETDILIMGTHGHNLVRYLIGSVTHKLLRDSDIPIVTVGHVNRPPAFSRILLATDFSEGSKDVLLRAIDLAHATHAKLVVVNAIVVGVEGGAEAGEYLGEARVEKARAKFDQWRTEASRLRTELETIEAEGPAPDVILNTAEDTSADLILISKGIFLGSVAERVIRHAHIPVMTIPFSKKPKVEPTGKPRAA